MSLTEKEACVLNALLETGKFTEADLFLDMILGYDKNNRIDPQLLTYRKYIHQHKPTCKVCNKSMNPLRWTITDFDPLVKVLNTDCGCASGYYCYGHKPENAVFLCEGECYCRYLGVKLAVAARHKELESLLRTINSGHDISSSYIESRVSYTEQEQREVIRPFQQILRDVTNLDNQRYIVSAYLFST